MSNIWGVYDIMLREICPKFGDVMVEVSELPHIEGPQSLKIPNLFRSVLCISAWHENMSFWNLHCKLKCSIQPLR